MTNKGRFDYNMGIVDDKEQTMTAITQQYDTRHGSAYDRGSADAWYGREARPHYFTGATYQSDEVVITDETSAEYEAYMAGYEETPFGQKDWG